MSFTLNNERATGVLIWWIEGADGSIAKNEEELVEELLSDLNYNIKEYHEDTIMHISGLSSDKMDELVDEAIQWGAQNFSEQRKQKTVNLLVKISERNETTDEEQEKLDRIKREFKEG